MSHVIARRTWRQQRLHGTRGKLRKRIRRWLATMHWIWMCQLGRQRESERDLELSSAAIGILLFSLLVAGLWAAVGGAR